jgi:hypothetical protein
LTSQFLRNSLKKTRGTSWSLRLSKELNNQIETFDSPSLEKVCPRRDLIVQAGDDGRSFWGWEEPPGMDRHMTFSHQIRWPHDCLVS